MEFPIEAFHLLVFTVPGFFVVWSYHTFSGSKIESDFEYLMFSLFWGLILVVTYSTIVKQDQVSALLKNHYAAALSFSILGFLVGYIAVSIKKKIAKKF